MIKRLIAFALVYMVGTTALLAEQPRCLKEVLSATGKPSKIGELARGNAFFTWESLAKEKQGAAYMAWPEATERQLTCIELMNGPDKGKWECTRKARPCKAQKPTEGDETASISPLCKGKPVEAFGKMQRTPGRAKNEARSGWRKLVDRKFGQTFSNWQEAKQTKVSCQKKREGQYQCVAAAIPCRK